MKSETSAARDQWRDGTTSDLWATSQFQQTATWGRTINLGSWQALGTIARHTRIPCVTSFLNTMVRITDPERSRAFYEALGFKFTRDMDIVRNGELEATNYFFSIGDQDNVLELTYTTTVARMTSEPATGTSQSECDTPNLGARGKKPANRHISERRER